MSRRIHWTFGRFGRRISQWYCQKYSIIRLTLVSLFYNDFADKYYLGDTSMEPMFWFVDHFTKILGPVCVIAVLLLASSLITIAYVIGLPFYLRQHSFVLTVALILGHWLLVNVVFYYYMAYTTGPGFPPQGAMITEAVSICKRCIAPKPARTHHCSVCNKCILKMDHHCPWLNNCIGHFNHRYFFMFCLYVWIGIVFVIIFGIPVAYEHVFEDSSHSKITPVVVNFIRYLDGLLTFKSVPAKDKNENVEVSSVESDSTAGVRHWPETVYHTCIVYAALLCVAVLFVVGGLLFWHGRRISKGETSIEGHINKKESARLLKEGRIYKNPYDLGSLKNWKIFLSVGYHRPWWHLLFPFADEPLGDGMQWNILSIAEYMDNDTPNIKISSDKIS